LANGQVHGAVDQATGIAILGTLFEKPDEVHLAQGFFQRLGREGANCEGQVVGLIFGHGQTASSP
jgi:hypothetical protein